MKILTDKCGPWLMQCRNQRSREILKSYSRLLKMNTPVSPWIFALKSWRPKEWFYTSSYPETSLTMLSTMHCGIVKGGRSLVPTPFPLVSDSLGHPHVTENDWRQNCTRQVFFTFVGNYDKCIANEARNTSLLYYMSRGQKRAFTTQGFLNTTLIIESRTRSILS